MPKKLSNALTALEVGKKGPGRYADGGGLYGCRSSRPHG